MARVVKKFFDCWHDPSFKISQKILGIYGQLQKMALLDQNLEKCGEYVSSLFLMRNGQTTGSTFQFSLDTKIV